MKDQLLLLLELQAIDVKVKELDGARKALPMRNDPLRNDLAKLEAMLAAERKKLADSEAWKAQQQAIVARDYDLMRAAKSKLQGTRTGKEFHAATREVEFKRKSISDREAELKKVTEALEGSTATIGERDAAIQGLRDQLAEEDARTATLLEELDAKVATTVAGRDELRAKIEPGWRKTYDSLIVRGLAVVSVHEGTCQGCRVRIPPQLNNKLARLESIETCERCARIIYRKEMLEPPAEAEAAATPPAAE